MGLSGLANTQQQLIAHGRSPETPVAVVENGTRPGQRVVCGTLGELSSLAHVHALQSPSLLIVGEVAGLANRLHWYAQPPLTGTSTTSTDRRAA